MGERVKAYAEWPCQSCGQIPTEWITKPHGPNLGAYCPDCGGRCGHLAQWISKVKAGLSTRSVRTTDFEVGTRWEILDRDQHRCWCCGRKQSEEVLLQVDHIVPVAAGGPSVPENGITLCEECNLGKRASFSLDFVTNALIYTHTKPSDRAAPDLDGVWRVLKRVAETLKAWRKEQQVA